MQYLKNKPIFAWALYDWANSAYSTTVVAAFFPIFFKNFWSKDVEAVTSTYLLGMANFWSGIAIVILAPLLGAIADRAGYKKEILFIFTLLAIIATLAMAFLPAGALYPALFVYGLSAFAFAACMIPYDALLVDVSSGKNMDSVSGFGYATGYLGGGLLLVLNVLMVLQPAWFGLRDNVQAIQLSFILVAVWWAVFSIPLFIHVKEQKKSTPHFQLRIIKSSFVDVFNTLKELMKHKEVFVFLLAYFFYIEGVNTTIKMAVNYGLDLGFKSDDLIVALIIVQFVAFPFAIFFGWVGEKWGARIGLMITILVYIFMSLIASSMTSVKEFYLMAGCIGSVQGGIQSLSRSYFAAQIPASKSAEFFGFYNMLGKFSAAFGPLAIALVVKLTQSPRATSYVLMTFFVIGFVLLNVSAAIKKKNYSPE